MKSRLEVLSRVKLLEMLSQALDTVENKIETEVNNSNQMLVLMDSVTDAGILRDTSIVERPASELFSLMTIMATKEFMKLLNEYSEGYDVISYLDEPITEGVCRSSNVEAFQVDPYIKSYNDEVANKLGDMITEAMSKFSKKDPADAECVDLDGEDFCIDIL